jgi:myo-inositol-1(or 4)-monophosphatase
MPETADPATESLLAEDWLGLCRRVVEGQRQVFARTPGIAERTVYEGRGEGGDRTLAIDRECEDLVFAELERLAGLGHSFTAISEERGEVAFGGGSDVRIVVDPIDGSLNARRTLPTHALSVAVASGPALGDVEFGFVHDFGAEEEFVARRGGGATLNDRPLVAGDPGAGLEVVGVESANPETLRPLVEALAGRAYRIRAVGSIAVSLCYVAAARFDAMLSTRYSRSVDAAAGQLVVREAGALMAVPGPGVEGAGLGLAERYPVVAALRPEMLATVLETQERIDSAVVD